MVKVGDKVPHATLRSMSAEGPKAITTEELFAPGKKVVAFALPGAFTPTCSAKHVPGFVSEFDKIKAKGVDTIACISVNDAFVMGAWGKEQKAGDKVLMLGDGGAEMIGDVGAETLAAVAAVFSSPPNIRARPMTSSSTVPSTASLRRQYTPGARDPRVNAAMLHRLGANGAGAGVPHR